MSLVLKTVRSSLIENYSAMSKDELHSREGSLEIQNVLIKGLKVEVKKNIKKMNKEYIQQLIKEWRLKNKEHIKIHAQNFTLKTRLKC
jgi:hypothetical protein